MSTASTNKRQDDALESWKNSFFFQEDAFKYKQNYSIINGDII